MKYPYTSGALNAKVVIVGESLGETEKAEGRPFIGTSGYFLFKTLEVVSQAVGYPISRSDCYVTNVFKEIPPRNYEGKFNIEAWFVAKDKGRTDLPRVKNKYLGEFAAKHYLLFREEIMQTSPHIVITLGAYAAWAMTGIDTIKKVRGTVNKSILPPHSLTVSTYHPSFIMQMGRLNEKVWRFDFAKAFKVAKEVRDTGQFKYPNRDIKIIRTFKDLLDAQNIINKEKMISYDIETAGSEITIVGFGLTSKKVAYVIPLINEDNTNKWNNDPGPTMYLGNDNLLDSDFPTIQNQETIHQVLDVLKEIFENENVKKVAHNGSYDVAWLLLRYNMILKGYDDDTHLMHHAMNPHLGHSLGEAAATFCEPLGHWKDLRKITMEDTK